VLTEEREVALGTISDIRCFTLGESMLTVPSHLLICGARKSVPRGICDFSMDCDWSVVPQVAILDFSEEENLLSSGCQGSPVVSRTFQAW